MRTPGIFEPTFAATLINLSDYYPRARALVSIRRAARYTYIWHIPNVIYLVIYTYRFRALFDIPTDAFLAINCPSTGRPSV